MKHFNGLSPAQVERLAILAEECGEVIQVVGKILRHGISSVNPFDPTETTNRGLLEKELGDVRYASMMLSVAGDVDTESIADHAQRKAEKIAPYLHHQPERA